ncbi:MAG: M15 family metallopeptidase [Nocardioidaceae bacterium]|nr:M15 family metallopeptidase [Nocardioidaceae bacterium]
MLTRRWGVRALALLLALVVTVLASGCGGSKVKKTVASPRPSPSASPSGTPADGGDAPLLSPDLLVLSRESLPAKVVRGVGALPGVAATTVFSMGQFYVEEQSVTYATVDPQAFRRFTPVGTARTDDVWGRVTDGELAIRPDLAKQIVDADGDLTLGNGDDAESVHVGALAELTPPFHQHYVDAVLDQSWAKRLDLPAGNAMLVDTGQTSPQSLQKKLIGLAGRGVSVQILGPNLDTSVALSAVLTGGSVARAVGSFTYTVNADGTVNPDPAWVRDYIRTEQVPILGAVRCNKAMLPQLRAALTDIARLGLAAKIHKNQYGGCYVPRFIARDPSKGLSFHTFGTAIDLNVPENQRGTAGLIDRQVVQIFNRWGFNWGGTWRYTDPMHFELARIVKVR